MTFQMIWIPKKITKNTLSQKDGQVEPFLS